MLAESDRPSVTPATAAATPFPFGVVVCDESHYIKTPSASRTQALLPVLASARRVIMLSGTPALSRPIEVCKACFAVTYLAFFPFFVANTLNRSFLKLWFILLTCCPPWCSICLDFPANQCSDARLLRVLRGLRFVHVRIFMRRGVVSANMFASTPLYLHHPRAPGYRYCSGTMGRWGMEYKGTDIARIMA